MALSWKTTINATPKTGQKVATTHFGTVYTLTKDGNAHNWMATVTVPAMAGMGSTETLASGVDFKTAKAAAEADEKRNGGR